MQRNSASVYAKKNTKSMDENGVKGEKKAHGGRKSELPDRCRLSRSAWSQLRVFKFVGKCPEE